MPGALIRTSGGTPRLGYSFGARPSSINSLLTPAEIAAGTYVVSTGFPTSGLVARWEADAGVTLDGADVTAWTDSVNGLALIPFNASYPGAVASSVGGAPSIRLGDDGGFQLLDVGTLPVGAAARTTMLCWRTRGETTFGGFGYGSNGTATSFVLCATNDAEPVYCLDYKGGRITGSAVDGEWIVLIATYDGSTIRLYEDGVEVASAAIALNTGSVQINVAMAFAEIPTACDIGLMAVWSGVISATEIAQAAAYARARWAVDITAPALSGAALSGATASTLDWAVTTDDAGGTLYVSAETSATPLSVAAIKAAGTPVSVGTAGALSGTFTGLSAGTTYYLQAMHEDQYGNPSPVAVSSGVATSAADATAPVLSSASGSANGANAFTGSVSTDEGNGTLYWVVTTSATGPSAAQVAAGQDHTGASAVAYWSQTVTATGAQAVAGSGLAAETAYYVHYMHEDASTNRSTVATSGSFTTAAASGTTPVYYTEVAALRTGGLPVDERWAFLPNILESAYDALIAGLTATSSPTAAGAAAAVSAIASGNVIKIADGDIGTALNSLNGKDFAAPTYIVAQNMWGVTARGVIWGAPPNNLHILGIDFGTGGAWSNALLFQGASTGTTVGYCRLGGAEFRYTVDGLFYKNVLDRTYPSRPAVSGLTQQEWNGVNLRLNGTTDMVVEDNLILRGNQDSIQSAGGNTRHIIRRNALLLASGVLADESAGGGDFHPDGIQTIGSGLADVSPTIRDNVIIPSTDAANKGAQGVFLSKVTGTAVIENNIIVGSLNNRVGQVYGGASAEWRNNSCMCSAATIGYIRISPDVSTSLAADNIVSAIGNDAGGALVNAVLSGNIQYGATTLGTPPSVFYGGTSGTYHMVADWAVQAPNDATKGAAALLQTVNDRVTAAGV